MIVFKEVLLLTPVTNSQFDFDPTHSVSLW